MSGVRNSAETEQRNNTLQNDVTASIVDNWLDNTSGTSEDDGPSKTKAGHGKAAKHLAGKSALGLAAPGVDAISSGNAAPGSLSDGKSGSSGLPTTDTQPTDETSAHFSAIDHLVFAGSTSSAPGKSMASTLADTAITNINAALGVATASGTLPKAVQEALSTLTNALSARPVDRTTISAATTTYVDALGKAGLTSAQIDANVTALSTSSNLDPAAASALVEAAKAGINTDDSNKDKEASVIVQKQLDTKRNNALATQREAQQAAQNTFDAGTGNGGGVSRHGDSDGDDGVSGDDGGSADQNVTAKGASANESGDGQYGDVNVPANSKEYKGMTIEQLEASGGPVADAIKQHPELVADIKKASAATGVPEGLLAGLCYMETTFGADTSTSYDADGAATGGVTQVQQSIVSAYVPGGSMSNPADNIMACAKGLAQFYDATGSWGAALRGWNSFDPTDAGNRQTLAAMTDLTQTDGGGIGNYVSNILNYICEGKDPPG